MVESDFGLSESFRLLHHNTQHAVSSWASQVNWKIQSWSLWDFKTLDLNSGCGVKKQKSFDLQTWTRSSAKIRIGSNLKLSFRHYQEKNCWRLFLICTTESGRYSSFNKITVLWKARTRGRWRPTQWTLVLPLLRLIDIHITASWLGSTGIDSEPGQSRWPMIISPPSFAPVK